MFASSHRWLYFLIPSYRLMERISATRESARRLGLVTLAQTTRTLVHAVENLACGSQVVEVPEIRSAGAFA